MSRRTINDLAYFGAAPAFAKPIHVAQLNMPPWEAVEAAYREIFARRYFTNNGPLVRQLDKKLAEYLGVAHAICVTNGTVALQIMMGSLAPKGEVIVPAFTFAATVQAVSWAGLKPVLCDVDPDTQMLTADLVRPLITKQTRAILGTHLWGRPSDPAGLAALAREHGVALMFDACHTFGCTYGGASFAGLGVASAYSLHATKVVGAAEGGFITTNDPALAAVLRDMRNFYSSESGAPALRTNGKMSEAQAAFGLLSLEEVDKSIAANRVRYAAFRDGLAGIPGITLMPYDATNNFQYVVLVVDDAKTGVSRDVLMEALTAENVVCRRHFFPGMHRIAPYRGEIERSGRTFPNTDLLCTRLLQLPSGAPVSPDDATRVCAQIADIVRLAPEIRERKARSA